MPGIRNAALDSLGRAIEEGVPSLAGRVVVRPQPNHALMYPSVEIDPAGFRYFPGQAAEVFDSDPASVVMDVGRHEGPVQLRLMYANEDERSGLENDLLVFFTSTPMHPGAVFTTVEDIPEVGPFTCTWDLEDSEWREELAFTSADQKHMSTLTITASIPALVARGDAPRIREIVLHLRGPRVVTIGP